MGVNGRGDIRQRRIKFDGKSEFIDEFRRSGGHELRAEKVLTLDERERAAARTQRCLTDDWFEASLSVSSSAVIPTVTTSKSVKTTARMDWASSAAGSPAMTAAAVRPSYIAL